MLHVVVRGNGETVCRIVYLYVMPEFLIQQVEKFQGILFVQLPHEAYFVLQSRDPIAAALFRAVKRVEHFNGQVRDKRFRLYRILHP